MRQQAIVLIQLSVSYILLTDFEMLDNIYKRGKKRKRICKYIFSLA